MEISWEDIENEAIRAVQVIVLQEEIAGSKIYYCSRPRAGVCISLLRDELHISVVVVPE